MKLLFDENLSHTLVGALAREFPDSSHVRDIALRAAEDAQIWEHARVHGFLIVLLEDQEIVSSPLTFEGQGGHRHRRRQH